MTRKLITSPSQSPSSPNRSGAVPQGLRVVLASEVARLGRAQLCVLEDHGFELVERYDLVGGASDWELESALEGAWGFVAGGQRVSRALLEHVPSLKIIARTGVGFEKVDVDAATGNGVTVVVTPVASADSVADLTVGLMLAAMRQIVSLDGLARSGRWHDGITVASDLHYASVGIVGLGHIGRSVAHRLTGFNCRLLACEPGPDLAFCQALRIERLPLEELLPRVDVLTLHVPLTSTTRQMIGAHELELLPNHAVLINTSRGEVVDERALIDALATGGIAAAGLDVFEREPLPRRHRLSRLPNVVVTPHVASYSRSAVTRVLDAVIQSLMDAASDTEPAGSVNGFPSRSNETPAIGDTSSTTTAT